MFVPLESYTNSDATPLLLFDSYLQQRGVVLRQSIPGSPFGGTAWFDMTKKTQTFELSKKLSSKGPPVHELY